jgi:DNA-binding transcriptional LysR family regulator
MASVSHASPLTPELLEMVRLIAQTGSFAAAARALGKVPSAVTYSVRQLEEQLDVLLFDRRSRQAQLTEAGAELVRESERLLSELASVAQRIKRVATGWEAEFNIAVDSIVTEQAILDLVGDFLAQKSPTRIRLLRETLSGTWEALVSGRADLAIGVADQQVTAAGVQSAPLGEMPFLFVVAPGHPLAGVTGPITDDLLRPHRMVALADSARQMTPMTVGLLPGQDVLTVPSMALKIDAQLRGLGCGYLPEPLIRDALAMGQLVEKQRMPVRRPATLSYAWRVSGGQGGPAQHWWLERLGLARTRQALLGELAASAKPKRRGKA